MKLSLTQKTQLLTPAAQQLFAVLCPAGEMRIVGGAVRDVLMNRPIGDIDFATTLPPEHVMKILAQQNIKTVPTGLAHGTITAVLDKIGYEITTLRRDVVTDGRHAQIAFTDNWREDAARRDFTFNALYVDAEGQLYDYFDGQKDAASGYVRFIGQATARIHEDVLRILRFFRFHAWFGQGAPDAAALKACHDNAHLIPRLSAERVAKEILKLLAAENPLPSWTLMLECGVLEFFAPEADDTKRLQNLLWTEKQYQGKTDSLTRLAALLPQDETAAAVLAKRLKFSSRDSETLSLLANAPHQLEIMPFRAALYALGATICRAAIFLRGENILESLTTLAAWENPIFPIKGEDLLKQGIPAGERIGMILRATEEWWIKGDFHATRDDCLAYASQYGKK